MRNAWEIVQTARDMERPTARYFVNALFQEFTELHGDRNYRDDPSILAGIGYFEGRPVTVIAEEKGVDLADRTSRNFGSPHPEGYRKALRLMRQAEKFGRPVVCLVDTQGAYCGLGAEERGQGEAIARNLRDMTALKVPVITVILSEGGSGGALALAVADRVYMLENAIYSILSPEGFAAILWKDSTRADEAAGVMKITAPDLKKLNIIEEIIKEPPGGAQKNRHQTARAIKKQLRDAFAEIQDLDLDTLLQERYDRFRNF